MALRLLDIDKLRQHEMTDPENLKRVKKMIADSGIFKEPIVIDQRSLVVLDGHHRLRSCRELGLKKIPCLMVDYMDSKIKVTSRRKEITVNKREVIRKVLSNELFPCKTTRHSIPERVKGLRIPLELLL